MSKGFAFSIKIKAFDGFSSKLANISSGLDRFGKKATRLGKNLSLGLTAPIVGAGAFAIKSAADIEQMTIALEGMTGGAEGASKVMKDLMAFSASTPFQLEGISDSARMLLATEKIQVDELQSSLKVAGDIAAGSKSQINDIAYVMSKAAAKGRADMEILNMFLERGIPIMSSLEKETGKNGKALEKMVSKGQISYDLLYNAMRRMTTEGGVFENMMAKQSVSIKGLFSTLQDNFTLMSASLGSAIVETTDFKAQITGLTGAVQNFSGYFESLPKGVKNFAVWTGIAAAGIGPLIAGIGQVVIGMGLMVALAPQIATAFSLILVAAPWLALAGFVIGIGVQIWRLYEAVGSLKGLFATFGAVILDAFVLPLRAVAFAIEKIWGLFGTPPAFLKTISGGSMTRDTARHFQDQKADGDRAKAEDIFRQNRELRDVQDRALKGDKAAIKILFENAPKGMKSEITAESTADVTVEQGLAMNGGY